MSLSGLGDRLEMIVMTLKILIKSITYKNILGIATSSVGK